MSHEFMTAACAGFAGLAGHAAINHFRPEQPEHHKYGAGLLIAVAIGVLIGKIIQHTP